MTELEDCSHTSAYWFSSKQLVKIALWWLIDWFWSQKTEFTIVLLSLVIWNVFKNKFVTYKWQMVNTTNYWLCFYCCCESVKVLS
jgi:hypothetical protein